MRYRLAFVGLAVHAGLLLVALLMPAWARIRLPRVDETVAAIAGAHLRSPASDESVERAASGWPVDDGARDLPFVTTDASFALTVLLALGVCFVGLLDLRDSLAARKIVRRAMTGDSSIAGALVSLRWSCDTAVPFVRGMLRPTIVLPESASSWSPDRLELVLAHELAHVARRDLVWRRAGRIVRAVFWFSPIAWWLQRELEAAAEGCCDEAVIERGFDRADYATELVAIARQVAEPTAAGLALVGSGRRSMLERRIEVLLSRSVPSVRPRAAMAGVVSLALAASTVSGAVPERWWASADGRIATGCRSTQADPHVHRVTGTDSSPVWEVSWRGRDEDGRSCLVRFVARPSLKSWLARGLDIGSAWAPGPVELYIDTATTSRRVDLSGRSVAWRRAFANELDLHTGFFASALVPRLRQRGGDEAVFDRVAVTQGDHAGLRYLQELVRSSPLDEDALGRVLAAAAGTGQNRAEMNRLRSEVAERSAAIDDGWAPR